jgi:hypothetical protein
LVLVFVLVLVVAGTYMQVLIPNLTGQAVDCYLSPYAAASTEGFEFDGTGSALAEAIEAGDGAEGREENLRTEWRRDQLV